MKKTILALSALLSLSAIASNLTTDTSCNINLASGVVSPKVICQGVSGADINAFYSSNGWVNESSLQDAKLCIYDQQVYGSMNLTPDQMNGRDQVLTVKLLTAIDGNLYSDINHLGADSSTFENGSQMELVDAMGQGLSEYDSLDISYDAHRGAASYKLKVGNGLFNLSSKAHVKLEFANCEVQY